MTDDLADDEIATFEARQASGFTKENGKHVAADGLVGRKGQRRILPDGPDSEELDDYAERLTELAHHVLRGQDVELFERRFMGGCSVAEVADQFGKTPDQIYKWSENIVRKLKRAVAKPTPALDREPVFSEMEWLNKAGTYIERRFVIRDGKRVLLSESWAGDHQFHQSLADWRRQNTAKK